MTDPTRTGRLATADEIAAAAEDISTTGTDYQLVDRYGVTYTGPASHLAVAALIRADLTPELYRGHHGLQAAVRLSAHRIGVWFTCPYTEPAHAAAFATLTPHRVFELVAHLVNHGNSDALDQVGPASLAAYTGYLTTSAVDDPAAALPTLSDNSYRFLSQGLAGDGLQLDITATAPDGAATVVVRMNIEAREDLKWDVTADVPVPVAEINDVLRNPNPGLLGGWLENNLALIREHLDYDASFSSAGVQIEATIVAASTTTPPPTAVFYVGIDQVSAFLSTPLHDEDEARTLAEALGYHLYTAAIRPDSLRRCR